MTDLHDSLESSETLVSATIEPLYTMCDTIYLTGSWAQGIQTERSVLDLILILRKESDRKHLKSNLRNLIRNSKLQGVELDDRVSSDCCCSL